MQQIGPSIHQFQTNLRLLRGGTSPLRHPLRSCSSLIELKTVFFLIWQKVCPKSSHLSINLKKKKSSTSEGEHPPPPLSHPLRSTVFFLIWQKVCTKSSHQSINFKQNLQLLREHTPCVLLFSF